MLNLERVDCFWDARILLSNKLTRRFSPVFDQSTQWPMDLFISGPQGRLSQCPWTEALRRYPRFTRHLLRHPTNNDQDFRVRRACQLKGILEGNQLENKLLKTYFRCPIGEIPSSIKLVKKCELNYPSKKKTSNPTSMEPDLFKTNLQEKWATVGPSKIMAQKTCRVHVTCPPGNGLDQGDQFLQLCRIKVPTIL